MYADAELSEDLAYRYSLTRVWDDQLPRLCFVMLNPSTADHTKDDPTIRVCIGRAKILGFGSLVVVNLFAYRATYPKELYKLNRLEAIGNRNNLHIMKHLTESDTTIVAWGMHGSLYDRDRDFWELCEDKVYCLGMTGNNQPRHPLRISYNIKPITISKKVVK